jgi:hypothetical protein
MKPETELHFRIAAIVDRELRLLRCLASNAPDSRSRARSRTDKVALGSQPG